MTAASGFRIDLRPDEWFLAGWRKSPALPLPAEPPFDPDAVLQQFKEAKDWRAVPQPSCPTLSAEEARFWLAVLTQDKTRAKPPALAQKLAAEDLDKTPSIERITDRLRKVSGLSPLPAQVFARLLT